MLAFSGDPQGKARGSFSTAGSGSINRSENDEYVSRIAGSPTSSQESASPGSEEPRGRKDSVGSSGSGSGGGGSPVDGKTKKKKKKRPSNGTEKKTKKKRGSSGSTPPLARALLQEDPEVGGLE